jgi:RHS repeat-associated protein
LARDAWNRLTKVTQTTSGATVAEYRYDGTQRRIVKLIPNQGNPTNWDRTDFYYTAGWQGVEDRLVVNGAKETVAPLAKYQYVWDLRYLDALCMRDENKDGDGSCVGAGDDRLHYLHDMLFNVRALVNISGQVMERYRLDLYGRFEALNPDGTLQLNQINGSYSNQHHFTGQRRDSETGIIYFKRRYYNAELARFISRDPLLYVDSLNLFFAKFIPNGLDPMGERDLTAEELAFIAQIEALIAKAGAESELGKALAAFISNYKQVIAAIRGPENPVRIRIVNNTLRIWSNPEKARTYLKDGDAGGKAWVGKYKCNLFVGNVLADSKVPEFRVNGRFPLAGEWTNNEAWELAKYRVKWGIQEKQNPNNPLEIIHEEITDLKTNNKNFTEPGRGGVLGDVIALGPPRAGPAEAHVGIALGHGLFISASNANVHGQVGVVITKSHNYGTYQREIYRSPD